MSQIQTQSRNYGVDLLRIVSMFLVCMLHVLGPGGVLQNTTTSTNFQLAWFLETLAFCAVNCYALISGYVGLNSKHKYSGIINLWLQVVFYCVLITAVFSRLHPESVTGLVWQKAFFPVSMGQYWYFTAYFLLFFTMPVLNAGIKALTKEKLRTLIIITGIILTFLPRIFERDIFKTSDGYGFIWLAYLYVIGGYIKLHNVDKKAKSGICLSIYFISTSFSWFFKFIVERTPYSNWSQFFISYMSPTMVTAAIGLFLLFAKLNISKGKSAINFFAPLSFSVFLIHTHPLIFSYYFTNTFSFIAAKPWYILLICTILCSLGIYFACSFVDIVRHYIFKHVIIKLTNFIECKIAKNHTSV